MRELISLMFKIIFIILLLMNSGYLSELNPTSSSKPVEVENNLEQVKDIDFSNVKIK